MKMKRLIAVFFICVLFSTFTLPVTTATSSAINAPQLLAAKVKKTVKAKTKKKLKKAKKNKQRAKLPKASKSPGAAKVIPKPKENSTPLLTIVINGQKVDQKVVDELKSTYGGSIVSGNFWYDKKSGAYGKVGEGMITFLKTGHDFGHMPTDASNGATGVYVNARQLPQSEVNFYTRLLGPVLPASYWLDGDGNYGVEGLDIPLGNLILAAFQSAKGGSGGGASAFPGGGGNFSRNWYTDSTVGSQGGCSYVSFGDGSSFSSGC